MWKKAVLILAASSMVSACYSFRGPRAVLKSDGIGLIDRRGNPRGGPIFTNFTTALEAAQSRCRPPEEDCSLEQREPIMERAMRAGYALIYAECSMYFIHMGRNQGRSRLGRSLMAPLSALVTGIISIVRFEDLDTEQDLLAVLSLATTASGSGLDVYDQNFLFGADNIDAVRQLTMRSLATHANTTLGEVNGSFEQVVMDLMENQHICTPTHIMTMTRQAIRAGEVEPNTAGTSNRDKDDDPETPPDDPEPAEGEGLRSTTVSVEDDGPER